MANQFLLYGANGYTGQLIARHANEYHLQPVLAGRNKEAIQKLSSELHFPYLIIDLDNREALEQSLGNFDVVLNAAGPFDQTAHPMADACIRTKTHYLDINGDISVFESLKLLNGLALAAGIMIMPGAGFDVVPTDCLALFLKHQMPDATDLKMAFATAGGGLSRGTATTMINNLGEGGKRRIDGKIVKVPLGEHGLWITFGNVPTYGKVKRFVISIPWGDVSTAYFTTGIENIEIYTGMSVNAYRLLKLQRAFNWLLRTQFIRNLLKKKVNNRAPGPTDEKRSRGKSFIWGEVSNASGEKLKESMVTTDGYSLTAHSTLIIVQKILAGDFKPGYQTPASAYSSELIFEVPGTRWLNTQE
ncbi:saccharopine dehydrogenase family protein [Flavitalea sp.]|nr:saccharopine dehydrogenase NADP-binding domain-containing protein [Flavitalea sp.]